MCWSDHIQRAAWRIDKRCWMTKRGVMVCSSACLNPFYVFENDKGKKNSGMLLLIMLSSSMFYNYSVTKGCHTLLEGRRDRLYKFFSFTLPSDGQAVAKTLSNSYCFVFPAGHGIYLSGTCPDLVISKFLANPSQRPNESCVAEQQPLL